MVFFVFSLVVDTCDMFALALARVIYSLWRCPTRVRADDARLHDTPKIAALNAVDSSRSLPISGLTNWLSAVF